MWSHAGLLPSPTHGGFGCDFGDPGGAMRAMRMILLFLVSFVRANVNLLQDFKTKDPP